MSILKGEQHQPVHTSKDPGFETDEPHYCVRCGEELSDLFDDHKWSDVHRHTLHVLFAGGYAAFYDVVPGEEPPRGELCHDCAHILCDTEPWIEKLLHNGHTHDKKDDCYIHCYKEVKNEKFTYFLDFKPNKDDDEA
jgi:hypothetical protein